MQVTRHGREPDIFDIIDSVLNDFPTISNGGFFQAPRQAKALQTGGFPFADIFIDEDKNYVIKVALSGIPKEKIDLTIQNRVIDLKIDLEEEAKDDEKDVSEKDKEARVPQRYLQRGIKSFTFVENSWTIPEKWDVEQIKTDYKDGLLTVVAPLRQEEVKQLEKRTLLLA
jgi:HSP20 family molecular chaperone IbpA